MNIDVATYVHDNPPFDRMDVVTRSENDRSRINDMQVTNEPLNYDLQLKMKFMETPINDI